MKTPRLFFTMIVCAALMRGVCYADPLAPASEQSHSESSNATAGNHPNDAKRAASVDDGKYQTEGKPSNGNQDNRGQSGPNTATRQFPPQARSTALVPLSGSSFGNTRHHGSVPAIIGGPASAKHGMTATINRTAMLHKP
jgi:hypothetical protein